MAAGTGQIVTLSLFRFQGLGPRAFVLGQMALARIALARMPGVLFWKLCGSGTGQGFTPRPNWGVWAILAVWPDLARAEAGVADGAVFARWRGRAAESWTLFLSPLSSRGAWAGAQPFLPAAAPDSAAPFAVLTRATLRPSRALRFWARVPDISARIGANPDVAFKIGIGEFPLLNQITFSVWPDLAAMARFAHQDGPHARAIRAVRDGDWFREELYARFSLRGTNGQWEGGNPLAHLTRPDMTSAKDVA